MTRLYEGYAPAPWLVTQIHRLLPLPAPDNADIVPFQPIPTPPRPLT
jgi:hypothetical protein